VTALARAAEKAREWTLRRNTIIRQEHEAGRSLRAIATDAGLTHGAIAKILKKGMDT
jgi:hypothetical protein